MTEFGGPEALHLVDVPPEPLGPGQVRLRVQAAAVSPTDTHLVAGAYAGRDPVTTPPWVPGMDVAGVVTEVADGVDHL
ncbi:MAG: alcohol dehydrogenase catalytic domain-containing protein, partial [Actinomycetes bacterium]